MRLSCLIYSLNWPPSVIIIGDRYTQVTTVRMEEAMLSAAI